jgi:hypothetical protein
MVCRLLKTLIISFEIFSDTRHLFSTEYCSNFRNFSTRTVYRIKTFEFIDPCTGIEDMEQDLKRRPSFVDVL